MPDLIIFAAAYCLFHATHGIFDFWVQTSYQADNKTKKWDALWRHVLVYTLGFVPAIWFLSLYHHISIWKFVALLLFIGLPHAFMDRRKFLTWFSGKLRGWGKPEEEDELNQKYQGSPVTPYNIIQLGILASVRVFVTIEMDQKFHYLCLALTALWLAL